MCRVTCLPFGPQFRMYRIKRGHDHGSVVDFATLDQSEQRLDFRWIIAPSLLNEFAPSANTFRTMHPTEGHQPPTCFSHIQLGGSVCLRLVGQTFSTRSEIPLAE